MRAKLFIGVTLALFAAVVFSIQADAQPGYDPESAPPLIPSNYYVFRTAYGNVDGRLDEMPSGQWVRLIKNRVPGPNECAGLTCPMSRPSNSSTKG